MIPVAIECHWLYRTGRWALGCPSCRNLRVAGTERFQSDGDEGDSRGESRTPDSKSPHGQTFELVGSTAEGSRTEIRAATNPPPPNLSTTGGRKDRPASLKLTAASPLIHTSFASPMTSSRVQSGSSSLLSLAASATSLSPPLGSTSSLRGKPENGGGPTNLTSPIEVSKNEEHPQSRIIIEDDEESSGFAVAHSMQDNSPRSADRGTLPGYAASEASQVVVPLPVSIPSGTPASPPDNLSLSSFPFPPR